MPQLAFIIQVFSALLAFAAAVFWLKASCDVTPDQVAAAMKSHGGMDIFGSDLTKIVDALIQQGRLNAYAAFCAALAALLQGVGIIGGAVKWL
jgi:hypothetical protein